MEGAESMAKGVVEKGWTTEISRPELEKYNYD